MGSADKASLFFIDPEKNELIFRGKGDESPREMRVPITKNTIAGYVATTGELLRIDDVYALGEGCPYRFNKEIDKYTGYRTKSILTLPVTDHTNERIGVIQLINKTVEGTFVSFNNDDERLLEVAAIMVAMMLTIVRLSIRV